MYVASLCGSFRETSTNQTALDVAAAFLQERGASVTPAQDLEQVPAFRPSHDDTPPKVVDRLRDLLEGSDGFMLAAPEYAGGLAGGMKNSLDWLVGSASIYHKPVIVLSVGTTGGEFAIEQLVRTLSWQGSLVVDTLGIAAPRTKMDATGAFVDKPTIASIEQWGLSLLEAGQDSPPGLLRRVGDAVTPFGIDPTRFGDLT